MMLNQHSNKPSKSGCSMGNTQSSKKYTTQKKPGSNLPGRPVGPSTTYNNWPM